jgi:hypothetical protein
MPFEEIRIKQQGLLSLHEFGLATQYFPQYPNKRACFHKLDVVLLSFTLRGTCIHVIDDQRYPVHGPSIGITHLRQTTFHVPPRTSHSSVDAGATTNDEKNHPDCRELRVQRLKPL